jgi:hypothetical protein
MRYLDPGRRISQSPDPRPTSRRRRPCPQAGQASRPRRSGTGRVPPATRTASLTSSTGPAAPGHGRSQHRQADPGRPTRQRPPGPADIRARRPQTGQAVTIGGAPARLRGMHRPLGSGFPAEPAATIHDGTAFVIGAQDPTGTPAAAPAGRAPSRPFLADAGLHRSELDWRPPTCPVGGFSRSGAGSQPRLNLLVPLAARPPAITGGSVPRQPDNLCSQRRQIIGRETVDSASGAASLVLTERGRSVGGLGPGLTSDSADAVRAVLRDDLPAGPQVYGTCRRCRSDLPGLD